MNVCTSEVEENDSSLWRCKLEEKQIGRGGLLITVCIKVLKSRFFQ